MIRQVENMYIRKKLDLIICILQLIHDENVAIGKSMCGTQKNAQELGDSWNAIMDGYIEKYKKETQTEGMEDGE